MSNQQYGAIFDMDGVLVDNAEFHTLAFEKWCAEMGIPFDAEDFNRRIFGKQNRDIFRIMLGRELTEDELWKWDARKEALYREVYAPHVHEVPGLAAFLRDLVANGFKLAVATSGSLENVQFILRSLAIEELFSAVVTAEDISRGKPDPQVFLVAMERIGLPAADCVVFEDSPSGAGAAVASDALFIGVATGHKQLIGAARMIADFTEISAPQVREMISAR